MRIKLERTDRNLSRLDWALFDTQIRLVFRVKIEISLLALAVSPKGLEKYIRKSASIRTLVDV